MVLILIQCELIRYQNKAKVYTELLTEASNHIIAAMGWMTWCCSSLFTSHNTAGLPIHSEKRDRLQIRD